MRLPCRMVKGSRWVGVLVAGVLSQGCSFTFVDGPPDRHEKMLYFDCTSSLGPAVVDITYAATSAALTASNSERGTNDATTAYALTAGVFGASAIYGIMRTQACNQAKDDLRRRLITIFERDARLRAQEMQRVRTPERGDLLTHPKRLPKRKKKHRPPPPEQALPPTPPSPQGEPSLPPPTPGGTAPAPSSAAPSSSALPTPAPSATVPVPPLPNSPPAAAPAPAQAPAAPKSSASAVPLPAPPPPAR
jgi:hypothetical protein